MNRSTLNHHLFVLQFFLSIFVLIATIGCSNQPEGPSRYRVSGTVQFQGKPLPLGRIVFSPDTSQGNKGSQGVASIHNGRFDTAKDDGKKVLSGPHTVKIFGFDGTPYTDDAGIEAQDGRPLFTPWETQIEVKDDDLVLDLVVPQKM